MASEMTHGRTFLWLLALTFVGNCAKGREGFAPYPSYSGAVLGIGWNTFSQSKAPGSCIEFSATSADQRRVYTQYVEVSDTSSLMDAFSISAQAKVSSLLGGGGGGSAQFSRSVKLDTADLNVAVDEKVIQRVEFTVPPGLSGIADSTPKPKATAPQSASMTHTSDSGTIRSIRLTGDAARMLKESRQDFERTCGDGFVSTIRYGSGIQGVLLIKTRSVEEHKALSGKLSGSSGAFSGSTEASEQVVRLQSEKRLDIRYFQLGGDETPVAINVEQFGQLIRDTGKTAIAAGGSPFEVGVTPYKDLPNYVADSGPSLAVEALASQYYRLESLDDQINDMHGDAYFFNAGLTADSLKHTQDDIKADMKKIRDAITACASDPKTCAMPSTIAKSDYPFRERLPVRTSDLADVVEAQNALAQSKAAFDKTPKVVLAGPCPSHGFCSQNYVPNPAYAPAEKDVNDKTAALKNTIDTRNTAKERFAAWIEVASIARCRNQEYDVCLNHAQLDQILARMSSGR